MKRLWVFLIFLVLFSGVARADGDEERVTLNFQGAEALSVLEFYAQVTGKAFIPEDDLDVHLTLIAPGPVPVSTALDLLDALLALKGYSLVERDDYFKVVRKQVAVREALRGSDPETPSDRYVTEVIEFEHVRAVGVQAELAQLLSPEGNLLVNQPLNLLIVTDTAISVRRIRRLVAELDLPSRASRTEVYPIRYANGEALQALLTEVFVQNSQSPVQPTVTVNAETRQIVATGPPEMHERLVELLRVVDKRQRQVMIDVVIVEATIDDENQLGVEWQSFLRSNTNADGSAQQVLEQDFFNINTPGLLGGLQGLKYSIIRPDDISAIFGFFSGSEQAEILSTPHLVTLDGMEATLTVGEEIPLLKESRVDQNNNLIRSFQQQKVGINTTITPQIVGNDDVLLALRQEVSNVLSVNTQDFTSVIGQRIAETNVIVRDGHTLVIGGLMRDERKTTHSGIPVLMDIPILGSLFRTTSVQPFKAELLIFITPRVLETEEDADDMSEEMLREHPGLLDLSGEEFPL
ncbi:hypothetical protein OAX78_02975 [Planctomycetota bacterium]|nr:hypothetical protein [Planctomycetota bacterium]